MKPSEAGILFVGHCALFAGVCAEALPPDSIPIKCATICGPMVELSSICSGKSSSPKSNSKRAQKNKEFHQINNEHVIQRRKHTTERAKQPGGLDERDFTVIVPAPTSFPSSLIVDESAHPPQQSKITRIRPSEILPTQQPPPPPSKSTATQPPPPPPAPTKPQSTNNGGGASTNPGTNRGGTTATSWRNPQSTMDAMNDGDGDGADDGDTPQQTSSTKTGTATSTAVPDKDQGRWTMNSGEKDCVCENKSFNVQQVAALCSSCIAIANRRKNGKRLRFPFI